MYLAGSESGDNIRVSILTEVPTACPSTTPAPVVFQKFLENCEKTRATITLPLPTSLFNCTYKTPNDYAVTFYVMLEVDLASDVCSLPEPPIGSTTTGYWAGNRMKALSPTCQYITVKADCMPSTCDPGPLLSADVSRQTTVSSSSNNVLPIVIGVSVGTGVLVLAIIGGVLYTRKRQREEALRRKLNRKYAGGFDDDESVITSDEEDPDELDFSGKSHYAAAYQSGAFGAVRSMFMGRSALFSRAPRGAGSMAMAARHAHAGPGFASVTQVGGHYAASEAAPSMSMGQGWHDHDRISQARYADKYASGGVPMTPTSPAIGSVRAGPAAGLPYASGSYNMSASYSMAFTGRGSANIPANAPPRSEIVSAALVEIETHEDQYQLARMSGKLTKKQQATAAASGASRTSVLSPRTTTPQVARVTPKSPSLPRPMPAVTPQPGVTTAQIAEQLGMVESAAGSPAGYGSGSLDPALAAQREISQVQAAMMAGPPADMLPENASAFINPLAMMGGAVMDEDSDVDESRLPDSRAGSSFMPLPKRMTRPDVAPSTRAATGLVSWEAARAASKKTLEPAGSGARAGGAGAGTGRTASDEGDGEALQSRRAGGGGGEIQPDEAADAGPGQSLLAADMAARALGPAPAGFGQAGGGTQGGGVEYSLSGEAAAAQAREYTFSGEAAGGRTSGPAFRPGVGSAIAEAPEAEGGVELSPQLQLQPQASGSEAGGTLVIPALSPPSASAPASAGGARPGSGSGSGRLAAPRDEAEQ
ncbi:hypothetical protein HYH03_013542 [Edaphochlamys debaryana]|uniref:Uncharacterized protein n=1 Tax=Edaphochlamys debaryana TaxID=47281 RepID=A0A836BT11_9CHLO|nr:hypothetical protein HYH03_013542 [Edaphochlamys debaryana]|eukprot:KAG2487825.1 hypothetical protein HYH03_013542 [Edaphochlamys debaryana]